MPTPLVQTQTRDTGKKPVRQERRTDRLLVVHVESTCWDGPPPKGQTSEIIQVGLVWLDTATLAVGEPQLYWVKPARSEVSPFCTRITGIVQAEVDRHGRPLAEVCGAIRDQVLKGEDFPWASYGDYDRRQFERNCRELSARYPFGGRHTNAKTWVAAVMGWPTEVGLGQALPRLGLTFQGTPHRGDVDALNIARLLAEVFRRCRDSSGGK